MSITSGVSMRASDRSVLAQFLRREMNYRQIRSTRELAECIGVSQGTAWRLISSNRVPKEETLRLVANAFGLPIPDVRDMANRPSGEVNELSWPPEFNQLSARERDALIEIGWAMIEAHDRGKVTR